MTQVCTRCIYDEYVPNISFDEKGVCSYCKIHDEMNQEYPIGEAGQLLLEDMAAKIKKAGKGKKYDCIIGVSGGCDSSYLLHLAKVKLGLRPLAVHFDNTWNTKTSVENIKIVLEKLNIDLWTYVVDNDEWNELAKSMLQASVPEIDALTDVAVVTTYYMACDKFKIKYILNGHSFRTEGITPLGWLYFDGKYIDSIHKQFGKRKMRKFQNLWLSKWIIWLLKDYKRTRPLYYIDYNKEKVKAFLTKEYGWKWYGGHHLENRYTAYCHYLMGVKFKRDFRYVEFSALIRAGQMTREQALEEIKKPQAYPLELITEIKKRLNISDAEYEAIINLPIKSAKDYKTYRPAFRALRWFFWLMYKMERVPKSFYVKYCLPDKKVK